MECDHCFPSQPFVVLTVDQFVGHGGGPLELKKQDGHVQQHSVPGFDECIMGILLFV